MRTVRSVDIDASNTLWVATSGGVFTYSENPVQTVEYRNINALQSLDCRTLICLRDRNEVVVGGGDGSVDILDAQGTWLNITDIKRATQYARRGVTDLLQRNDTLYIATEFGLLTYDLKRRLFIETVDRIGTLQEKTLVYGLTVRNDSLWIATESGLAVASLRQNSLRPPEAWTVLGASQGFPVKPISTIASTSTTVYCSVDTTLYSVSNGTIAPVLTRPDNIINLSVSNDVLYWSSYARVGNLGGAFDIPWSGVVLGHGSVVQNGGVVLLGFIESVGLNRWDFSSISTIELNSPVSNKFARMALDSDGGLWVVTDIEPPRSGEGVNYFDGSHWTSMNVTATPELGTNSCYRVSALTNGEVLIGTWGKGGVRARMTPQGPSFTTYTPDNSAVQGISSAPAYSLVADAAIDRNGTLWMVNEQAASQIFVSIPASGVSTGHANCIDSRSNQYRTLAIDGANNKWIGSTLGSGLVVWNDKGTEERADDICNVVRTSNSLLPDNVINALAVDKSGAVWIGTPHGVAVMSSPYSASNSSIPYVRSIPLLSSAIVNDIFVDALNYKWIATSTGVFVLNEDGTEVIAQITKSTAPLLDENIRSIVVDGITGIAYFGTSSGCTTAQTSSLQPSDTYSLSVYPQPFRLNTDAEVVIDGLAADSDLRILTVGGYLVRALQVRGRQATWDGMDTQGRQAPPGVYILQATSASSKQNGLAKIVVQR